MFNLDCGKTILTDANGNLTSPFYPNNYPLNAACTWKITVPSGKVLLVFHNIELEDSSKCSFDYLLVSYS